VVLATGDGDFVPLVEYLKGHGVICEVIAFKESTNATLKTVADSFIDMSADSDRYLIPDGRPGMKRKSPNTKRLLPPKDKDIPRNIRISY